MAKVETAILYNHNGPVVVNKAEINEFLRKGFTRKPQDGNSDKSVDYDNMSKSELVDLAAEKGHDVDGMKKAEIRELLKEGE